MKKFEAGKELEKIQNKDESNKLSINYFLVSFAIILTTTISFIGLTFSSEIATKNNQEYTIKIEIINGYEDTYIKKTAGGAFKDTIDSPHSFGQINCQKGSLIYDEKEHTISSNNIKEDTFCIISFNNDNVKNINTDELLKANDNNGISYYYKGDANNNYLKLNNNLFRIVRINGDGSLRLILNEELEAVTAKEVENTLKNWFDNNFKDKKYIINNYFDTSEYDSTDTDTLIALDSFKIANVGLLSLNEASLIKKSADINYLDNYNGTYLSNNATNKQKWILNTDFYLGNINTPYSVKPVINIKTELLKGQGTFNNPYEIEE